MLTVQRSVNFHLCHFRCGVAFIALTQEQIGRGCEVKQVEKTPEIKYPACCRKFVKCP